MDDRRVRLVVIILAVAAVMAFIAVYAKYHPALGTATTPAATEPILPPQRHDAEVDAMRPLAAPRHATRAAQLPLSRLQPRLQCARARLHAADRAPGRACRYLGADRRGAVGLAVSSLSRVPTGFLPIKDQGYFLVALQLPRRTTAAAGCHRGRLTNRGLRLNGRPLRRGARGSFFHSRLTQGNAP